MLTVFLFLFFLQGEEGGGKVYSSGNCDKGLIVVCWLFVGCLLV